MKNTPKRAAGKTFKALQIGLQQFEIYEKPVIYGLCVGYIVSDFMQYHHSSLPQAFTSILRKALSNLAPYLVRQSARTFSLTLGIRIACIPASSLSCSVY